MRSYLTRFIELRGDEGPDLLRTLVEDALHFAARAGWRLVTTTLMPNGLLFVLERGE